MIQEKQQTGFPSLDKPWLKYYDKEVINATLPKATLYNYLLNNTIEFQDKIAINYYNKNYTYRDIINQINITASALENLGVRKGEIVTICTINSPETIFLIFALNKIGAIANLIYGVSTESEIKKYIEETNTKFVFTLDIFQNKFQKLLEQEIIEDVIVIESNIVEMSLSITNGFVSWEKFISLNTLSSRTENNEKEVAIITYTGGTTGGSKGVMQSSEGILANVWQYCNMKINLDSNSKWLLVFPLFISFGVFSLLIPLSQGMTIIIRTPMADSIADLCKEFKPNHIMYGPAFWEAFANDNEDLDLSYLIEPMTGGDTLLPSVEEKLNNYLLDHGCYYRIMNGYGMSELGPGISINCKNAYESGSVGVPFVKNIVSAFDVDTGEELTYGKRGELCVCAPSMMVGYINNPDETNKVIIKHKDGKLWVHTGDLGYISENGFIHLVGRIKRYMLCIANGVQKKVFSLDIEKVLNENPYIEKSVVVPMDDTIKNQVPVAYIKLKDFHNNNLVEKDLIKYCEEKLDDIFRPVKYFFVNEFPLTKVGKIDYRALEMKAEMQ